MAKRLYYIGVDLGGTYTKIALVDKDMKIVSKKVLDTMDYKRDALIDGIAASIIDILCERNLKKKDISGIGMGVAGLVDNKKGIVRYLTNVPGWRNVRLKNLMERRLNIKTYVDNDVNVMALAEFYKGAGRGARNLVCITLGTGVGGGVVIDGKLYRGSASSAGEIGHIPINERGPRCNCGGAACIESYIGNRYLIERLKRAIKSGKKTVLGKTAKKDFSNLTPESVYKAALLGDEFAVDFWNEIGGRIGIMLAGVINLLNPDRIIIGGGMADAGRFLFNPLKKTVRERAIAIPRRHVKIVKAQLGKDAGLAGAAVLVSLEKNK